MQPLPVPLSTELIALAYAVEVPVGKRGESVRKLAFGLAGQGATNDEILNTVSACGIRWGKYRPGENLYAMWNEMIKLIHEIRKAGYAARKTAPAPRKEGPAPRG